MKELWRTLHRHRRQLTMIVAFEAVLSGVEAAAHPLLLKELFDHAILAGDVAVFLVLGAGYLALGLAMNFGSYWTSVRRKRYENAFVLSLEAELLDRALDQDGRGISAAGNASFVSRIHNDVAEGVLPAIDVAVRVAKQATASVVFAGVLLYLSWQASIVLLLVVPPLVLISNRLARRIEENTEPEREAEARYINTLTRTLASFRAVRGLPLLRPLARAVSADALRGFLDITLVNSRLRLRQRTLSDLTMNLSDTASLVVGAFFVFAGRMSFGSFLAFVNSLWRAVTGIVGVINLIPQLRRSSAVLRRIQVLRGTRAPSGHGRGSMVALRGVRAAFGSGATVSIDNFTLRVGEHVLLRGSNGCGKTTLLHVIAGILAPDAGTVTVPPRVACLSAPVELPPLPVHALVADERLRETLGLQGLAGQLPADLSSGQRQRLGVAALLCEDADVYLVDEPFANLDPDGRDLVLRVLQSRTVGRGLLVVHHGDEVLDGQFDRVATLSGTSRAAALPTSAAPV
ncbi:ABC transporter ATP-binding protein/permease [Micromonospora lupini]|uniref:ATP-binding cassette domain-containing protein n=1 Tax=Micromonospora lupini TaxID=285679 RepID=UPI0022580003|nr:ABC transporter ATP-binding protein [Micromonospora lupini]MCX5066023.1 ABC transporter ATP-binding protein/permease [Micromonospora lupini]